MIELLVVLTVIALLLSIAVPRYAQHVDLAQEVALKHDLFQMRDAIDKFHADQGRYPGSLEELTTLRYLRSVPADPFTRRSDAWRIDPPPGSGSGVGDVHSSAPGQSRDGTAYASW